jgi:hypothetical protein
MTSVFESQRDGCLESGIHNLGGSWDEKYFKEVVHDSISILELKIELLSSISQK